MNEPTKTFKGNAEETENALHSGMELVWSDRYGKIVQRQWNKLPNFVGTAIASLAVFLLGSTMRGEWLLILVHFLKAYWGPIESLDAPHANRTQVPVAATPQPSLFENLPLYWIAASSVSYVFYFGIGGFLHWYFYVRQRENSHEWKCQPNRWLSPELERHEILIGSFSLIIGSTISSVLACYVSNGGWSTIYYDINENGILWYLISWPLLFVWQDYLTYWHHRFYHLPFIYKSFHKLHHKYKQPTAFSVTAIHPVEFMHIQAVIISPMFLFPVHWSVFCTILLYIYYHGIIDHSGINFKAQWWQPWQPDCMFHDNHHQYFHVNFGFNCSLWDKIHGTHRQNDKIYNEHIFYGFGKEAKKCTEEEVKADLSERQQEHH